MSITEKAAGVLERATNGLIDGTVSVPEWAVTMRENMKMVHVSLAQLAHGGKAQMGPRQLGQLGAVVRRQNEFLRSFVLEVESGSLKLDGSVRNRAKMYADAGWGTYEGSIKERERNAGMAEERSFLEPGADHCEECPDEAGKGWSQIGSLIPVGSRTCLARCRCSFEYR